MRKALFIGLLFVAGCSQEHQQEELEVDEGEPAPKTCTAFESQTFVRTSDPTDEFDVPFALANPQGGPFLLRVASSVPPSAPTSWYCELGGWSDACRAQVEQLRSATISLNGQQILGPSDFAQGQVVIERTVSLAANNTLKVQLASAAGTSFAVSILDGDDTAPAVSIEVPRSEAVLATSPALVQGTVDDPAAHVLVNYGAARVAAGSFFALVDLDDETHTIKAVASDACGNSSSAEVAVDFDASGGVELTAQAGLSCQGFVRVSGEASSAQGVPAVRAVGDGFDIPVTVAEDGTFNEQIDIGSAGSVDIVASVGYSGTRESLSIAPAVCAALDDCHDVGVCDPATEECTNPERSNDAACDDGDACTQSDTCQAGVCTGANPVVCVASNQCHEAGICDSATGDCSVQPKPDGTACNDYNPCTGPDSCEAGRCAAGVALVVDDVNLCTHDACDPRTGVSHTPVPANTSCSDGDACNGAETCDGSGRCVAGTAVVCVGSDVCHLIGVCNPETGACSNPERPDGEPCDDATLCNGRETCQGGACTAGTPPGVDDHNLCTADSCEAVAGVVHNHLPAGTSCETDNDVCNGQSACDAIGGCQPGTALPLDDGDACTLDTCDPVAGVTHATLDDGSPCEDGDLCTSGETCQEGICAGSNPVVCSSSDPCEIAHCEPATGECVSSPDEACRNLPSDPVNVAPPIDPTLATSFGDSLTFLFTGDDPIQTGADVSRMDPKRTALLRGVVLTTNGDPLPGARVSVLGHPEYGETKSREDGHFDLVANGGDDLVVVYERAGYVTSQRRLTPGWQSSATAPDVRLAEFDTNVTTIQTDAATIQVARGGLVEDEAGQRQATLLFRPGTEATLVMPDGGTEVLTEFNVRATEVTVGEGGPEAMPADLPSTTLYTYAAELSLDEAIVAGADRVDFSEPVTLYLENFVGFPVGVPAPLGVYDRASANWVPSPSGHVLEVLSVAGGVAEVDVTGDRAADDVESLGITDEELEVVASLYEAGQTLWRVSVPHFSPCDVNWAPFALGAIPWLGDLIRPDDTKKPDVACGSYIECQNQVVGHHITLPGLPYGLSYKSDRVRGYRASRAVDIPIVTSGAGALEVTAEEGARRLSADTPRVYLTDPPAELTQRFIFDDRDAFGRPVQGDWEQKITVNLLFQLTYGCTNGWDWYWPTSDLCPSGTTMQWTRTLAPFPVTRSVRLRSWDARGQGFGGWSPDVHHVYDPYGQVLYRGDGTTKESASIGLYATTVAGTGSNVTTEGLPGLSVRIHNIRDILASGDGTLTYLEGGASSETGRVRRIARDGTVTTLAGAASGGLDQDGIPATLAVLSDPRGIEFGKDGLLYIAERAKHRIRRVERDGTISTVAGTGTPGFSGDGGLAIAANLNEPTRLAAAPDGTMLFVDSANFRIRRLGTDGNVSEVFASPSAAIADISVNREGVLYFTRYAPLGCSTYDCGAFSYNVVELRPGADLRTLWSTDSKSRGMLATIDTGVDGYLYVGEQHFGVCNYACGGYGCAHRSGHILRLDAEGRERTVAGSWAASCTGGPGSYPCWGSSGALVREGVPALDTCLSRIAGVAIAPDGNLYTGQGLDDSTYYEQDRIRRLAPPVSTVSGDVILIPEPDTSSVHVFDPKGRHLRTVHANTGKDLYSFSYDAAGRLIGIKDSASRLTTIYRDAAGAPTAIVSPDGVSTRLEVESDGYLSAVTTPGGRTTSMAYADGLLTTFVDPNGSPKTYSFDELGRLASTHDAEGGSQTFARSQTEPDKYAVTRTTGEERTTTYQVTGEEHITTAPDGTSVTRNYDADVRASGRDSTGVTWSVSTEPDPRFGGLARFDAATQISTRLGRVLTTTQQRVATLANPADFLSLTGLTETVTTNGKTWQTVFTGSDRTYLQTSPAGRQTKWTIDDHGRVLTIDPAGLARVTLEYDAAGRLEFAHSGDGADRRTTRFDYDESGWLSQVTDPTDRVVEFERGSDGEVLEQHLPGARSVRFEYDRNGNVTVVQPPGRPDHEFGFTKTNLVSSYEPPAVESVADPTTSYAYNLDRDITLVTRPDGHQIGYKYDDAGRPSYIDLPAGYGVSAEAVSFAYTPATGQLATLNHSAGIGLSYTYDGFLVTGETISGVAPSPVTVSRDFDADFRLKSEALTGTDSVAFGYDADGLLTSAGALTLSRSSQNGLITGTSIGVVTDSWTYNEFAEPRSYTALADGVEVFSTTFERDPLGRITRKLETIDGVTSVYDYHYDLAGRLEAVDKDGEPVSAYSYDDNGNRLEAFTSFPELGSVSATYDDQDRLLTYGGATFTYTDNGELRTKTEDGETTTYTYDVMGNLRIVDLPDGRQIEYLVDALGRRVGKRVDGVLVQGFVYSSQLAPIAELDGDGNVVSRFIYGTKVNVPEYMIRDGVTYRILADHLGSPRAVVDASSGTIVQRVDYDEWGVVLTDTNPGFQPFGFAGGIYDGDTGFVRFGARDYDARVGTWTAKDPILFYDSANVYNYVLSDPLNLADYDGRSAISKALEKLAEAGIDAGLEHLDRSESIVVQRRDEIARELGKRVVACMLPTRPKKADPDTTPPPSPFEFVNRIHEDFPRREEQKRFEYKPSAKYDRKTGSWSVEGKVTVRF